MRRWVAAIAVVGGLLVTVPVANAVEGRPPAGLVWVGRPPHAPTSTLYRAGPGGTVRRQPLPYSVNAIGCAADGHVYGLAAGHRGERFDDGPHPVRIRPDGTVDDLGPVTADVRHPLATGYAAALRADLTLVVATETALREVRLGPGRPTLTATRPLPGTGPFIGDWALDARGDLVTVTGSGGRATLLRLTADDLHATRTALPGLPAGPRYGGAAVAPDGSLYVVYHRAGGRGTVYRVPPTGRARPVTTVDPAESTDAAMCPVEPAPRTAAVLPVLPVPPPSVPASSPLSVPPSVPPPSVPATRSPAPGLIARTRVPDALAPPTGPAPGPRPAATNGPRPRQAVAAPQPGHRVTTPVIAVVAAVLLGAVVGVRLIRRRT